MACSGSPRRCSSGSRARAAASTEAGEALRVQPPAQQPPARHACLCIDAYTPAAIPDSRLHLIPREPTMTEAVIVSTARTPLCKSWKGAFNMTHGATLGGHVVRHALERARLDPAEVEDVIMGCANPEGATGWNIARQIALRAGMPVSVSGVTVNRFCSSGLQTVALASQRVLTGEGDVFVAGGVESISCVQNEMNQHMAHEHWLAEHKPAIYWSMLQTAETVAKRYGIPREQQDRYGVNSQLKAAKA